MAEPKSVSIIGTIRGSVGSIGNVPHLFVGQPKRVFMPWVSWPIAPPGSVGTQSGGVTGAGGSQPGTRGFRW